MSLLSHSPGPVPPSGHIVRTAHSVAPGADEQALKRKHDLSCLSKRTNKQYQTRAISHNGLDISLNYATQSKKSTVGMFKDNAII